MIAVQPRLTTRPIARGVLTMLAVALAFGAQYLFTGEVLTRELDTNAWDWLPRYSVASWLLVLAIGCAWWALRKTEAEPLLAIDSPAWPNAYSLWLLGSALACYAIAIARYLTADEDLLVQAAWLLGPLLLVVALWPRTYRPLEQPLQSWEIPAVLGITMIGFALRYWYLTQIPTHVENDVALMGVFGRRLIESENYRWIGYSASEHLQSYDQLTAWGMRLFGDNHRGLVAKSAISGTLTLPIVYLIGRVLYGTRAGVIAAVLLTIDYTHIHFSRIMFGPVVTFIASMFAYTIILGIRSRRPHWFALAGMTIGLALLDYDSGKVLPIIAAAVFCWDLIGQRKQWRKILPGWLALGLGALLMFGPMLAYSLREFDSFVGRGNRVALWTPEVWGHMTSVYKTDNLLLVVFEQFRRTFLTFHLYGDSSPHFAIQRPIVAPLTSAMLVLGVGVALARVRALGHFLPLIWIVLTFVLGGVITYDPPYWPHLNIALPAVALVASLGATRLIDVVGNAGGVWVARLAQLLFAAVVLFTGVNSWEMYLNYSQTYADARIRVSRYVSQQPQDLSVVIVGESFYWKDFTFQFFNDGVDGRNMTVDELRGAPPALDRPLLFILYDTQDQLAFLRERYPSGTIEEQYDPSGQPIFLAYHVIPEGYISFPPPIPEPALPLARLALGVAFGAALALLIQSLLRRPRALV
jgi:hypothetical protein